MTDVNSNLDQVVLILKHMKTDTGAEPFICNEGRSNLHREIG